MCGLWVGGLVFKGREGACVLEDKILRRWFVWVLVLVTSEINQLDVPRRLMSLLFAASRKANYVMRKRRPVASSKWMVSLTLGCQCGSEELSVLTVSPPRNCRR